MFCSVCGNKIENGAAFCPQCGRKIDDVNNSNITENSSPAFTANTVPAYAVNPLYVGDYQVQNKTLIEKCAWYAPVSIIVSYLLGLGVNALFAQIQTKVQLSFGMSSIYYYILAAGCIINFIIRVLPSFVIYFIATSKVDKKTSKAAMNSIYFLWFLSSIPSVIATVIYDFVCGMTDNFRFANIGTITFIINVTQFMIVVAFAVLAYFITVKQFKSVASLLK